MIASTTPRCWRRSLMRRPPSGARAAASSSAPAARPSARRSPCSGRTGSGSWAKKRLDRLALVHRAVALGGLLQRQVEIEDLAGVDLLVPDEVDQLGQEAA